MQTVGTIGQINGSFLQFIMLKDSEGKPATIPQLPEILNPVNLAESFDPDLAKLMQYVVTEALYYVERNPTPANQQFNTSLEDYQIELLRNTRLPLALTFAGLSSLAAASFFGLPYPYSIAALIALMGPAAVIAYGLKTQPN